MSIESEKPATDRNQDSEDRPIDQGIERFAKYTAPAMLAMLASAGQGAPAYAQSGT